MTALVGTFLSGGVLTFIIALFTVFKLRNKISAEAQNVMVDTAEKVVEIVNAQLAVMQKKLNTSERNNRRLRQWMEAAVVLMKANGIELPVPPELEVVE